MEHKPIPNILVFGSTGAGKSSVVNMLDDDADVIDVTHADVSNGAAGVTFSNTSYQKTILGMAVNVFDTVGLNEGLRGTTSPTAAVRELYDLTRQLPDGISLLVFVMRAPRITLLTQQNYHMFFDIICERQVPIVIVITGLENEENMDAWWVANEEVFDSHGMNFKEIACITATKGLWKGEALFEEAYVQSKMKVEKLIYHSLSAPWALQVPWSAASVPRYEEFSAMVFGASSQLDAALSSYGEVVGHDVVVESRKIERLSRRIAAESTPNILFVGGACGGTNSVITMLGGQANSAYRMGRSILSTIMIRGTAFNLYENAGFCKGTAEQAVKSLYRVTREHNEGFNLFVLVVHAEDIVAQPEAVVKNYSILSQNFLHELVPRVIVVTGLDEGQNSDEWWHANRAVFDQHRMSFHGHACIAYTKERSESADGKSQWQEVEKLIYDEHSRVSRKKEHNPGIAAILWYDIGMPFLKAPVLSPGLKDALAVCGGRSEDAVEESNKIERNYIQFWSKYWCLG
jgi:hypothetical protein